MAKTYYRKSSKHATAGAAEEEDGAVFLSGGTPATTIKSSAGKIITVANKVAADVLPATDPFTRNAANLVAGMGTTWLVRLGLLNGIFPGATIDEAWVAFALANGIVATDQFVEFIPVS